MKSFFSPSGAVQLNPRTVIPGWTIQMALDAASVNVKIPNAPERPQLDVDMTVLPLELVDSLNHAYFLHLLATDPKQVLPPGKSLLSMLSRSEAGKEKVDAESIQNKVEQMMRRAFWNEVYLISAYELSLTHTDNISSLRRSSPCQILHLRYSFPA